MFAKLGHAPFFPRPLGGWQEALARTGTDAVRAGLEDAASLEVEQGLGQHLNSCRHEWIQ